MSILFALALLIALPQPCPAHNGTLGQALPISGITLDGELNDWPADLPRYPLAVLGDGDSLSAADDFSASFRIGFDDAHDALYVAVEVADNSVKLDPAPGVDRDYYTQDGCELYIDLHDADGPQTSTQLRTWGTAPGTFGFATTEDFAVAVGHGPAQIRYEWRVDLARLGTGTDLRPGRSLGFDLSVWDADTDGSTSWISWSPGIGKYNMASRLGDMLLAARQVPTHPLRGRVAWASDRDQPLPRRVRLTSATDNGLWLQAIVDSLGHYDTALPNGAYRIAAVDDLASRVSPGDQVAVAVDGPVTAPLLRINPLAKPGLIPARGILVADAALDPGQIDRVVQAYMAYHKIPGLSLALIKDGRIAHATNYGLKNSVTKEQIDERTLFQAASMTKTVFAYAVARLVERGVLGWDVPLYTYWPYEDIAYDERYKKITARMVLSHRTGFPNWRDGPTLKIHFDPGSDFRYSGEGFEFLGNVVAHLTGKPLDQVLAEEVFTPLGIADAYVSVRENADAKAALTSDGHIEGDQPRGWKWLPEAPQMASSLHIAAGQYAKFALALMQGRGLSEETLAELKRVHSVVPEGWPTDASGLGLFITETPFGTAYGHSGTNTSFQCEFVIYPERDMGYVFMANNDQGHRFHESLKAFLVSGQESVGAATH